MLLGHMEPIYRDYVLSSDRETVRNLAVATGYFTQAEIEATAQLVAKCLTKGEGSGFTFLFAEIDSDPVGFSCYGPISCTLNSFGLYWLVTDEEHHRLGVGRKLLRVTETMIKQSGGARIYAETSSRKKLESTRKFFLSQGYSQEAVLPDFYAPGDGKHIFLKIL